MDRAYSTITIKAVDEDKREITGIASTPALDLDGDVVDPNGAKYSLPIPLLWQHDKYQPIGEVYSVKQTKLGLEVKARIVKVDAPSQLAARLQEAWQSIKTGLVRGLSIGFVTDEFSWIEATGGRNITKWRWLELSAVTIPANYEASITTIKAHDDLALKASSGKNESKSKSAVAAPVKLNPKGKTMKTKDEIKKFRDELNEKAEKLKQLAEKSKKESQTFDASDKEEFDTLASEVKELEEHIGRLETVARLEDGESVKTAKAVKVSDDDDGAKARSQITVKNVADSIPGLAVARVMKCRAQAKLKQMSSLEVAKSLYPDDKRLELALKSTNTFATGTQYYGRELVPNGGVYADFAEFLRPQTVVGKFGTAGLPALRRVPFRTALISQTTGANAFGVAEAAAKPTTDFRFDTTSLTPKKLATIAISTKELILDSSPDADVVIRDDLAKAIIQLEDEAFVDPANDGTGNIPISIFYNIQGIPASGTGTAADVRADIAALLTAYIEANNQPTTGVIIMKTTTAIKLMLLRNQFGQKEFPDITMNGGMLEGIPVITSEVVPADSSGTIVGMVNASDVYFGDEGLMVDLSEEATVNVNVGSSASLVNLWQENLVGFRAEKRINWMRRRASSVAWLSGVNWGTAEVVE